MASNIFYELGQSILSFGRGKRGWNQLYNTHRIGTKGPIYIDVSKPNEVYRTIPQLQTVINRFGAMFSNMEIMEVNEKTGENVTSPDFKAFISKPNPLQGTNELLAEYIIQLLIFGNQFMYKSIASRLQAYPTTLYNIPAEYMQPITTGKIWDQTTMDGIISGYKYQDGSAGERIFDPKDILYSRKTDPTNPIKGLSPIMALKYPLSNIDAGYKFENVTMTELGGIGMISGANSKDAFGNIPLTPEEKLQYEKQLRKNYGIEDDQAKIHVMTGNATYTPMSYPVKDMMLIESRETNFMTIIDHFKLNANIFSNKNSTYENLKNGILLSYQDAIQPAADEFVQKLNTFIGKKPGIKLVASFEHIPILKQARAQQTQSIGQIVSALRDAVEGKLMTEAEARTILANELELLKG